MSEFPGRALIGVSALGNYGVLHMGGSRAQAWQMMAYVGIKAYVGTAAVRKAGLSDM